jgi:outer membrane protein OmpA-like peptidoglycan-associated protein
MHSRSLILIHVALLSAFMFTDTGCRTKAGGWRWPWQKDTSVLPNESSSVTSFDNTTDIPKVMDEAGNVVSGSRFEDTLQAVQGVKFSPVYFAFDSYALPPAETSKIEQVARHLQQNPTTSWWSRATATSAEQRVQHVAG